MGRIVSDLRELEAQSIRAFVQGAADEGYLSGRVLDYGAGRMRYAEIVRAAGGNYQAFDRVAFPASIATEDLTPEGPMTEGSWDTILMTQVIQYVPYPAGLISLFYRLLRPGGKLVLTGPTNWPQVEDDDLCRLTRFGIRALLEAEGFVIERLDVRASIEYLGEEFTLGYGAVARRPRTVIYALTEPATDEPRYVGQTEKSLRDRLRGHINETRRKNGARRPVSQWIIALEGACPGIRVLEADPEDTNEAERRWHTALIREGYDLLNLSVGNRGKQSSPTKKRAVMGPEQRQQVSDFMRGRPKSAESNALRSISAKQRGKRT
jgi:SAM-dependent methyltransferase